MKSAFSGRQSSKSKDSGFRAARVARQLANRKRFTRPALEGLEPRLVMAADDVISVGRVVSAWSTADIQNNQEKITYTVYNNQSTDATGVLLNTTLQSGVAFQNASQPPNQNGRQLAWSLGTIPAFGHASIDVFVTFPGVVPLQLDAGAQASATVNAAAVTDTAPAARLRAGTIDANLLASTPDANTTDPFVQAKAAQLDYDPNQFFAFLRDDVSYESYVGSLRGARGTLWSSAGNALDEASLGIALFRASGIPARYVHGELGSSLAQELILSMFSDPLRVVGCMDSALTLADPIHDVQLLSEARDHYWVQFDAGSGYQDADSSFRNAQLGQSFATADGSFSEVRDALRHKVEINLTTEISSFSSLLGFGPQRTGVLTAAFNSVDLIGKPLTVGNFVNNSTIASPVFTAKTVTYSPYLLLDQGDDDIRDDQIIRGQDFQEVLTNFPLASQFLTGLFLKVTRLGPENNGQRPSDYVEKTIVDRLGFVARATGGGSAIPLTGENPPALTELDVVTLALSPSRQTSALATHQQSRLALNAAKIDQLSPQLDQSDPSLQTEAYQRLSALSREGVLELGSFLSSAFLLRSDQLAGDIDGAALTKSYFGESRIVAVSTRLETVTGAADSSLRTEFDILRNTPRSYAPPYQAADSTVNFQFLKGLADSTLEGQLLLDLQSPGVSTASSALEVYLTALQVPGATQVPITTENMSVLDSLRLSPEAEARISSAVLAGKLVFAPSVMLQRDGGETIAWLEADPASGAVVAVSENGSHGSLFEFSKLNSTVTTLVSRFASFATRSVLQRAANLAAVGEEAEAKALLLAAAQTISAADVLVIGNFFGAAVSNLVLEFKLVSAEGLGSALVRLDPPIGGPLLGIDASKQFQNLGVGSSAGVAAAIIPDGLFTVPFGGAQIPSVFRIGVKNLGPTMNAFSFAFNNLPAGFTGTTSLPQIAIPAGATAEIGVCLSPIGSLPAPGTPASFSMSVSSRSNATIVTNASQAFSMPEVRGIALVADPPALNVSPAAQVTTNLTLKSVGNVGGTVSFAAAAPTGVSLTNLNPVTLGVGDSRTLPLTVTSNGSLPLGSIVTVTIEASVDSAGSPVIQSIQIPIHIVAGGTVDIADAAAAADQLGNASLGNRLRDLTNSLTNWVQSPANDVYRTQGLAALDAVISLLGNDAFAATFVATLQADRIALSTATTAQAPNIVLQLGDHLRIIGDILSDEAKHKFTLALSSSSQVGVPQTPVSYQVVLQNTGTQPTTYDLNVLGLPSGATGSVSPSSITLQPGQVSPGSAEVPDILVTITSNSTTQTTPLSFQVNAAAHDAEEITRTVTGQLIPRGEMIKVVSVTAAPPFTNPGGVVNVAANILNAVNQQQTANVSYTVADPQNNIVFTSQPTQVTLNVLTTLTPVTLPQFNTTGLAAGNYTITVNVNGATATAPLLVGMPVAATLTTTPATLPPGSGIVTTTLQLELQSPLGAGPVTASVQVPKDGSVTIIAGSFNVPPTQIISGGTFDTLIWDTTLTAVSPSRTFTWQSRADFLQPAEARAVELGGNVSFAVQTHPLNLRGLVDTPGNGTSVAKYGNLAYVSGTAGISILDVSNPDQPQLLSTFTPDNLAQGSAFNTLAVSGDKLVVASIFNFNNFQFSLSVYSLTDPLHPQQIDSGNARYPYQLSELFVRNNIAYTTAAAFLTINNDSEIVDQVGDFAAIGFANPNAYGPSDALFNPRGVPGGGGFNYVNGGDLATDTVALLASTTAQGGDTQTGVGRVIVVNVTDPANLSQIRTLDVPGTVLLHDVSVQGNRALVIGGTGGQADPATSTNYGFTGNVTLTVLDTTDPQNPQLLNTTLVTTGTLPRGLGPASLSTDVTAIPIGNGKFAVSGTLLNDEPFILIVDVSDPSNLRVATATAPSVVGGLTFANGLLYAASADGLAIYDLNGAVASQSIILPPQFVTGEQIIGLSPATQTAAPGAEANYTVTLKNPTAGALTYELTVQGVPANWVNLPFQVSVPANGMVTVPLKITSDSFASLADYRFSVTTRFGAGATGFVEGDLILQGTPAQPDPEAHGVVVSLTPTSATTGQGIIANYVARVTNAGSAAETFHLAAIGLPAGFVATFAQNDLEIPPGASNFIDVPLQITTPTGTSPTSYFFTVNATSTTTDAADSTSGSVNVTALGVRVNITQASAAPGSALQLVVTNTGGQTDTFDLGLGGPAGLVSSLSVPSVTLAAGASQTVTIQVGSINFAVPGGLVFSATATSRANAAIQSTDTATINIAGFTGLMAEFIPATKQTPTPATVPFLLNVHNTGNTEDAYFATIVGTTGPLTASLVGLDGLPTQTIDTFRLPGLSTGAILLNATLGALGQGTARIQIRSQTTDALVAEAIATLATPTPSSADLSVTIVDAPDPVPAGGLITYTVTVANSGPQAATNVVLTDVLPAGVFFVSAMPRDAADQVTEATGVVTANLGTIASGATDFVKVVVRSPNVAGRLTTTASATATERDPSSENNTNISQTTDVIIVNPFVCDCTTLNRPGAAGSAEVIADADHPGEMALRITGTRNADVIVVEPQPKDQSGQMRVVRGGKVILTFLSTDVQNIVIFGQEGNDKITLSAALQQPAIIFGGSGDDTIVGGSGDDHIDGGNGNDTIVGGEGNDMLCGRNGNDVIVGGLGNDVLGGDAGNDVLNGHLGDDLLLGGAGNDTLDGAVGNDRLYGQGGNDKLIGGYGNNVLVAGFGNDTIVARYGRNILIGGAGTDTINGNDDDDILIAGSTRYDEDDQALQALLAEWASDNSNATRISNLRNGTGINGPYVLNSATTIDDRVKDTLHGNASLDWFWIGVKDIVKDHKNNEKIN